MRPLVKYLFFVMLAMLSIMALFETTKQLLIPEITLLQSHVLTILFSTFVGVVVAGCVLIKFEKMNQHLRDRKVERNISEAKVQQLTQLYAALSQCNQAIVRSADQDELFQKVCRGAVQFGGFKIAWIGITDPDTQMVKPVASFGDGADEYLHDIEISAAADSPFGCGPTGIAIRENRPFWCQDFQKDSATVPWRERGAHLDLGSFASLPLHREGSAIGAFTLYSSKVNALDEAMRDLLTEMALDISYALDNFVQEEKRRQTELQLLENEMQYRTLADSGSALIWASGIDKRHNYFNQPWLKFTGRTLAQELGNGWIKGVHPDDLTQYMAIYVAAFDRRDSYSMTYRLQHYDGEYRWIQNDGCPRYNNEGEFIGYIGYCLDINERKKVEAKLQKSLMDADQSRQALLSVIEDKNIVENSLRKLSLAVEQSSNSIVITDLDAKIEYANEAFVKATGYSLAEAIGQNPRMLHSDNHPNSKASYDDMWMHLTRGEAWKGELINQRKDGTDFTEMVWISPVRQPDGLVTNYLAIKEDITELKHAVEEIKFKNTILQTQQENSLDAILMVDENGKIISYNQQFIKLWHLPLQMVSARLDAPLLQSVVDQVENSEVFIARIDYLYKHREEKSREEIQLKNGKTIDRYSAPITGEDGTYYGRVWYFRDVTERKRAEAAVIQLNEELENKVASRTADLAQANLDMSRKEEEIRSVVDHMLDCVITIDEKGIVRSANPAVEKIFGYTHAEAIGQNVSLLMPEPDRSAHDSYLKHYLSTNQAGVIGIGRETVGKHKNGDLIALDLSVSEYLIEGQRYFTGILRDIRERQRIMDDLKHSRLEAEHANRAKSAFLASMSHEIRTPMNGVIGMLDVLQQSSLKASQLEMVNIIHDSAFALLAIIDDILDFSKIEAGKLHTEFLPMSIAEMMEGICETMGRMAQKKEVELMLFTDPNIPSVVIGDTGRLRQILINLAGNAIKFSSGQTRPGKVSMRALLIESTAEQVTLEFRVTDNGIGIDEATQARLFTAFTQAETSTTRNYGGTGLGLAISRQLVNMMGGEIAVQSERGKGAVFSVRLPFKIAPNVDGEELPTSNLSQVAGLRCLVLGDAESMADDLAAYLVHAAAWVERTPDLMSAKARIAASQPGQCIVIIDSAEHKPQLDELRTAALAQPDMDAHFVVIGRGGRRQCRREARDLVTLDGDGMHQRAFLQAVAIAAGRAQQPDWQALPSENKERLIPLSREEALQQGSLILIAEDNEINQKVILQQLTLLGKTADIAGNGRKALERWQRGDYAILITDLHMPEMDGYELTTAIRAAEAGKVRIPILAYTANALKGEAEHCRAVGMDDYLSKPVQLVKLKAMLEKWLPVAADAVVTVTPSTSIKTEIAHPSLPVDVNVLKALVGNEEATIAEFLHDFLISAGKIADELRSAHEAGQTVAIGALAHKLKSSARSVGALELGELCAGMELAGKANDGEALMILMPKFEFELAGVASFINSY